VWGRSRKGKVVVRQLTAKDRFARTLKAIDQQCRQMRHRRVREQHQRLCLMLTGHYAYFGITGNLPRLKRMYCAVARCWRKWLSRRSNDGPLSWEQFQRVLALVPLPRPRIVHGYA